MLSPPLQYAELGYPIFPCVPGGKRPLTPHGLLDATTDESQIEAWWQQWPKANVAIRTDGLLVVDVDPLAEGGANPWLANDHNRAADLASAPISLTPRGGKHYLFRQPPGYSLGNTTSKIAPHVDTRANGGYIVVPPSVLDGGKVYQWAAGQLDCQPGELPLPPDWLLIAISEGTPRQESGVRSPESAVANKIPQGQRDCALASMAGRMRSAGHSAAEILAALLIVNANRCQPPLEDDDVRRIANSIARYEPDQVATAIVEHWADQDANSESGKYQDPGEFPPHLLDVPGFINTVMAHNLAGAFKPQPVLALAASLALLGTLTGRKIRDAYGSRTNIYCLGICPSGGGKERGRQVNKELLFGAGLQKLIGPEAPASSAGVVSAIELQPAILFQWDEVGRLLKTMSDARDKNLWNVGTVLMKLYSSAGSIYLGDAYADAEKNLAVNQPHACLYGTTVPRSFYESLTTENVTDGFLSRMLIFESRDDPRELPAKTISVPECLLEIVRFWGSWQPEGNLADDNPQPRLIEYTAEAESLFVDLADMTYQERRGAEEGVAALWTRTVEKARKLALLYACSRDHESPLVDLTAARWGAATSDYLTQKLVYVSRTWITESAFEAKRQRVLRVIAGNGKDGISQTNLNRRTRTLSNRERQDVLDSLVSAGEIAIDTVATDGRPSTKYRAINP